MKNITEKYRRIALKYRLKILAKCEQFCKLLSATNRTVNNGNTCYFLFPYFSKAGGSNHWLQCLSLFTASGFFISLSHLKNSDL